jgi:glycosyltransferase involved in cell wall biosynthesis
MFYGLSKLIKVIFANEKIFCVLKILQLSNRVPWPLKDGGSLGIYYSTKGYYDAGCTVGLLAMNTLKHWVKENEIPTLFKQLHYYQSVGIDTNLKPIDAFVNLFFSKESYHVTRFVSISFTTQLILALQHTDWDIVQLEGVFLTPYISTIKKHSKAKIVVRLHNVEYTIWERMAAAENNFLKKKYLAVLAHRLKNFELKHINDYDLLLPITPQEKSLYQQLGCTKPMHLFPFGINNIENKNLDTLSLLTFSVFHLGAMDWLPNIQGLQWFLNEVWQIVLNTVPQAQFYMAGRNMPAEFKSNIEKNIHVLGEVADADNFIANKGICVIPLLSGGGLRVKMLQNLALGKPIVASAIGAEGIPVENNKHAFVTNSAHEMAQSIIYLLQNPTIANKIGLAGKEFVLQNFNTPQLIEANIHQFKNLTL